ncbi:MAG: mechanosensitive ion channel family protein [Candidatus Micrarchaeota archaeon]|nr:mechanosensitive ion channel family protein [Candidatus Micrarchaeota archaeon]MDE1833739.1 mechanosensitive ion channel family protein [Candidatus Micrarchaeota archaeon]MDE1859628.1 mechanosensitive ion channel family protein [Candidatus Micrarchaeota archaeon]
MPDHKEHPALRSVLRTILAGIVVLMLFVVLGLNVIYQLNFGSLSGIQYKQYIIESIDSILLAMGAYVAYRMVAYFILRSFGPRIDTGGAYAVIVALRVLFYIFTIVLVLTTFGVNLSTALAGGAIGGVVIGLAVQTVATNILSGFFVSSSRVLRPGDLIKINTGQWGQLNPAVWGEITCSVVKVGMLWTTVQNRYGQTMLIPNSILFSTYVAFTKLREQDNLEYVQNVTITADVPISKVLSMAKTAIDREFSIRKQQKPQFHIYSRNGSTNTVSVALNFSKFSDLNGLVDIVNLSFDNAYWQVKKKLR